MHKNEIDVQFWTSWLQSNPHKNHEFTKAKELYNILNGNLSLSVQRDRELFKAIFHEHLLSASDQRRSTPAKKRTLYRAAYIVLGIAAAFAGAYFIIPSIFETTASSTNISIISSHISLEGEKKFFQLSDGSQINLNSGSSISIVKGFNEDKREILLDGEAYFDIAHNSKKPFIIHTKWMDIKVLGTVFNVKAYPTDPQTEATLLSGSLEVSLKGSNNRKVILRPHEKIILSTETLNQIPDNPDLHSNTGTSVKTPGLTIAPVDSSHIEISWMKNQLIFDNESFERIAVELERNFNTQIVIEDEDVRSYRFTATFEKKTISQILEALKLSRTFSYEIKDGNKIIVRK